MKRNLFLTLIMALFLLTSVVFATESNNFIVNSGIEGEIETFDPVIYPETILEEEQDIFASYDSLEFITYLNNIETEYKILNLSHYYLKDNLNIKKRIYQFNNGNTHVINNTAEETTKPKTIELKLNLSASTQDIFLIFDKSQSDIIPKMSKFSNSSSSTIEVDFVPKYIKIKKDILKNNSLFLNLSSSILNFSMQIIELDEEQRINGVYNTNILQLNYDGFNKYTLFQINKNILEFLCPDCLIMDYGVNENGFSSCGASSYNKTNLEKNKVDIIDYLINKENVCLYPDGSKIAGFTGDTFYLFGLDKLYFEWNDNVPSDFFDYGKYYVDEDQIRIAASKKLDFIKNNTYIELNNIKYKKGKNNLISKVGTIIDFDLYDQVLTIGNASIDDGLDASLVVLNSIPEEYKKLLILDFVNNEPDVSDEIFEKTMQEILQNDYYKVKDYHTHYQISLEKYLQSFNNFKTQKTNNDVYSKLLYGLEYKTQGYSNIYFSEGLNYFIYNVKSFNDLDKTQEILNNEHTKFLGSFWKLNLLNARTILTPETVLVNLNITDSLSKEANIKLLSPSANLFVDYFSKSKYFSYNHLFYNSINALSFSRGSFFESTTSVTYKLPTEKKYENLQDGKLFVSDNKFINTFIKTIKPLIIMKEKDTDFLIKYYNGKEYVNYPNLLINTFDVDLLLEKVIIYPPNNISANYPLIIESTYPLLFNLKTIEIYENEKYKYSFSFNVNKYNILDIINNIENKKYCFFINEDEFSLWQNIDEDLYFEKLILYNNYWDLSDLQNIQQSNLENSNIIMTAEYNPDNLNAYYDEVSAVNSFLKEETSKKNLNVLKSYHDVYAELLQTDSTFKKDFINLFNCNETLICNVLKTKYTPTNLFYQRYKNVCKENTPSECVTFWSNPKVNYCAAFVRAFSNNFFNYKYDSANAWDLAKQSNNISVWKATDDSLDSSLYNYLIPGSLLGIKHNNTSYVDKEYSHVVVYLGKKGSKHYIIHSWGNTLKIEQLDVFLKTTARGKNKYGFYEDGEIKEVMISNNLNNKLKMKAKEKGVFLGNVDSSIYEGIIPDYIFDSFNNFELVSDFQKEILDNKMYQELEIVYNNILNKSFNIYYKNNPFNEFDQEINKTIKLDSKEPMIIILGNYKKLFLVNKIENEINILEEFPIATGVNGFGCEINSSKTPIGLFRISHKVGRNCNPYQIIGVNGCEYVNENPLLASLNSGHAYVVTRKLILDGLEKGNIGVGCENGNKNTISRGIYLHGTNYENSMGQQRSGGCIRMLNNDVISLFDEVPVNTYVYIYNPETSYSELLNLEKKFTNTGNDLEHSMVFARKPKKKDIKTNVTPPKPTPPKKTKADLSNYTDLLINRLKMINFNTTVELDYASHCKKVTDKIPCYIKAALEKEYEHVINPKSSIFNEIVFDVTTTFNYTLEETAQFWASVAQESGTSTNVSGKEIGCGDTLNKSAKGIAQIQKAPWSNYEKNKYTFDMMVNDFNKVDLSYIIEKDPEIRKVTSKTGNINTIDSRTEIIALLDLIWTNESKYASVIFSAGLKRFLGRTLISRSNERFEAKIIKQPFVNDNKDKYDNVDSINYTFALIYFYKYTGIPNLMFDGIKEYNDFSGGANTKNTFVLKLANYLAFKKEYYMYYHGMVTASHSDLLTSMKNAKIIK